MQDKMEDAFIATRVSAYQKLEDAAPVAADFCIDLVKSEDVPKHLRLKSAQDILDRTQAPKKTHAPSQTTINAAQIIINAYNDKHNRGDEANENQSEGILVKDVSPLCIEESGNTPS